MGTDPQSLKVVKEQGWSGILFCLERPEGSSRVFAGGSDAKVYELDLAAEKLEGKPMEGHSSYVTGIAGAGRFVVSGGYDRKLIWWDAESREKVRVVAAHQRWIRGVTASPDGKVIASVADDMICKLWNAETGELLRELRGHAAETPTHFPSMLFCCAFSPDGNHVAAADKVGRIIVWEAATGKQAAAMEAPAMYTWDGKQRLHSIGGIRALAFSPAGDLLAAGGIGQIGNIDGLGSKARVEIFDWRRGERAAEFPGDKFNGLVESLVFHPRGEWLLAAGGDNNGFLIFLEVAGLKPIRQEKAPMHVHALALGEGSESIIAVGHGKIAAWELKA